VGGKRNKMPSESDSPERWRALAAEAFEVARQLTDPVAKKIMLVIAEKYGHLAERAEKRRDKDNHK
jgi:hypothetical protein